MHRTNQSLLAALVAAVLALAPPAAPAAVNDLPDIGSPADAVLPKSEEARLGRSIMREIRQQGVIVDDPELTEYIQALGHELAAHVNHGDYEFEFFVIDDPSINAFALPGGYIGVHTGLIAATRNESQLAGVLAHEIAHVTQRHIARALHANQRSSLLSMAAMFGAVLAAAAADAGGEAIEAAVMTSQAIQVQNRINFTRSNEYEADRVGVSTLASAGFDPVGMAEFFGTMSRAGGPAAASVPEFLRTHPVNSSRIAEASSRARELRPAEIRSDSTGYGLAKARIAVRGHRNSLTALDDREIVGAEGEFGDYARALLAMEELDYRTAERLFARLAAEHPGVIAYRIGLGQAQAGNDNEAAALKTLGDAMRLFPRNVPLSVRYAQVLIDAGQPDEAHDLLLDLFNNVPPTLDQVRLIARAAIEAGETAEAHYYMSEYNIMLGDLVRSVTLLRRALALPDVQPIQVARFQARIDLVTEFLSDRQRRALNIKARNERG